jgi:hypothetical protein
MTARRVRVVHRIQPVLVSAYFWYVLLALFGASVLSVGVAIRYGLGHGLIALGALSIIASEMVRQGMRRA